MALIKYLLTKKHSTNVQSVKGSELSVHIKTIIHTNIAKGVYAQSKKKGQDQKYLIQ